MKIAITLDLKTLDDFAVAYALLSTLQVKKVPYQFEAKKGGEK